MKFEVGKMYYSTTLNCIIQITKFEYFTEGIGSYLCEEITPSSNYNIQIKYFDSTSIFGANLIELTPELKLKFL